MSTNILDFRRTVLVIEIQNLPRNSGTLCSSAWNQSSIQDQYCLLSSDWWTNWKNEVTSGKNASTTLSLFENLIDKNFVNCWAFLQFCSVLSSKKPRVFWISEYSESSAFFRLFETYFETCTISLFRLERLIESCLVRSEVHDSISFAQA